MKKQRRKLEIKAKTLRKLTDNEAGNVAGGTGGTQTAMEGCPGTNQWGCVYTMGGVCGGTVWCPGPTEGYCFTFTYG